MTASLQPLIVRDLVVAFPERLDRPVLDGFGLTAPPGRRIGLVGENGVGKSTLLRAVAGRLPKTARVDGVVDAPADLTFLGQEPPFCDAATVGDVLEATLRPLRAAVAEVERLAADLPAAEQEYAARLEWALDHDAWDADRRAEMSAGRLGLAGLDPTRPVGSLSGGQRTRLALATIMTTRPTCLLLDEPTNHLDDDAMEVVGTFLRDLPGVVVFASHDRVFLDDVATDLVDLDPVGLGTDGRGGRRFGGGWSSYERHRHDVRRRWEEAWRAQQDELDRLRDATRIGTGSVAPGRGPRDNDKFVHAFKGARVESTLARRRRQAARRLADAERHQVRRPPTPLRLEMRPTIAGGVGRVVLARDLVVAGRLRLDRLDVSAGQQVLISGGNGAGKSTLLGVLSGRITPTSGAVHVAARRAAELVQDVVFPEPRRSAEATYAAVLGEERAQLVPLHGLGLFHRRDLRTPVGRLSVGQRRRLGLALVVASEPDLLLLDEPTNHLSLSLAGELEEALGATPGTVVVASHDRWLRRRWTGDEVSLSG